MPARIPTSIKIARGTARKDRTKSEPKPPSKVLRPPAWLSKGALLTWKEFAPICMEMGTLTTADTMPMARYCEMLIQWRECQRIIVEKGMTFDVLSDDGKSVKYVAQRPEIGIANRLAVCLRALEGDLGLSALARGKIDMKPKEKQVNSKGRFFGR